MKIRTEISHRRFARGKLFLAGLMLASMMSTSAQAKVFMTADEAIDKTFVGCQIKRETVFLSDLQRKEIEERSSARLGTAIIHPYVATCKDAAVSGTAYLDTTRVRTLPQTVMVVLNVNGSVRTVETVVFREPLDYLPPRRWYEQFIGKSATDPVSAKQDIRPISGATLTTHAGIKAVRRVLAIHSVLKGQSTP